MKLNHGKRVGVKFNNNHSVRTGQKYCRDLFDRYWLIFPGICFTQKGFSSKDFSATCTSTTRALER